MNMEFNKKKVLRITGITLAILLAVIIVLLLTLPYIIKGSIQTVGSAIAGVPMRVTSISFNPFKGQVGIRNFIVGNPEGYNSEHAFKLESFFVDLDMSTLLSKKLVIEQIQINGVELNYETAILRNNISDIQQHVNNVLGTDSKEKKSGEKASSGKPLQVDHIELKNITAWVVVKGTKAQVPLVLPPVVLNKLGTGPDGVSSAAVVNDVLVSMLTSIAKLVRADLAVRSVGDGAAAVGKAIGEAASSVIPLGQGGKDEKASK